MPKPETLNPMFRTLSSTSISKDPRPRMKMQALQAFLADAAEELEARYPRSPNSMGFRG